MDYSSFTEVWKHPSQVTLLGAGFGRTPPRGVRSILRKYYFLRPVSNALVYYLKSGSNGELKHAMGTQALSIITLQDTESGEFRSAMSSSVIRH